MSHESRPGAHLGRQRPARHAGRPVARRRQRGERARRRAMSARPPTQVATAAGDLGDRRPRRRDQPRARSVSAAPVAGRDRPAAPMPTCARSSTSGCRASTAQPGADSALETVFNNFTAALQALATSPDSSAARSARAQRAQVLAQQLNGMTADIQALRSDAELGLADAVDAGQRRDAADRGDQPPARPHQRAATRRPRRCSDQRDVYIDQLSQLMDIKVVASDHNQVNVFTNSGIQLVGDQRRDARRSTRKGTMTRGGAMERRSGQAHGRHAAARGRRAARRSI